MSGKTSETSERKLKSAAEFWRAYYRQDPNFPPSEAACKFAEAYADSRAKEVLSQAPPEGEAVPEQKETKLICDGCNVRSPFEHRCHGSRSVVAGEFTNLPCECLECKEPQSARDRTEPTGQPEPVSRCNLQSSELAPESYKPAEEVSLQWPTNLPPTGMGAIDAITDLWTCDLKGLTAEEIKQAARIIDSLLEHVRRDPAATPVTVEAPHPFDIRDGENRYSPCVRCGAKLGMGISSDSAGVFVRCTNCSFVGPNSKDDQEAFKSWNLLATPKPIGDVEAVARQIITFLFDNHAVLPLEIDSAAISEILAPFFAPAGPEKLLTRFDEFDDQTHPCNKWWDEHGQYMMSGGGRREFIWACRGWIAHEQFAAGVEVTGDSLHETKPTIQAQPPCSECATLREKLEQWTKWGVVEVAVRNPQVAEYCDHWEGRAEKAEAECATLRKERDGAQGRIDEAWGKVNSLDRQKAHLLEVYARISKEKEAAEAQLSTLRDALKKGDPPTEEELAEWRREIGLSDAGPREAIAWLNEHLGVEGSNSLRESVTIITTCYRGHNIGARFVDREGKSWRLSEIMQAYAEFRAALAPTPEVAKE